MVFIDITAKKDRLLYSYMVFIDVLFHVISECFAIKGERDNEGSWVSSVLPAGHYTLDLISCNKTNQILELYPFFLWFSTIILCLRAQETL